MFGKGGFMKNTFKLLGIVILMAFVMFNFSACGGGAKGSGGGNGARGSSGGDLSEWEKYKSGIIKDFPSENMVTSVHLDFTNFITRFTDPSTGYYGYNYLSNNGKILLSLHYMDLDEAKADNLRKIIQTHMGKDLRHRAFLTDFHYYEATYASDDGKDYFCLFSHYFKGYEASSKLTFPEDAGYATLGFSVGGL